MKANGLRVSEDSVLDRPRGARTSRQIGTRMIRSLAIAALLVAGTVASAQDEQQASLPSFDYRVAHTHELKPHRRTVPLKGVRAGYNQLRLTLTVSPLGDVVDVRAGGDADALKFWPQLENEVRAWKFTPFEKDGKPVTAEVEEYLDLVPPERRPTKHVAPPALRPNSQITIVLSRTGCFGTCPSYKVSITNEHIVFEGRGFVVASGRHTAAVDADSVRKLARRFIAADFYSLDASYTALVTDNPTYTLSISVDGRTKQVTDYVGSWVGMPAVITELEDAVDGLAQTERWIEGGEGLVEALQAENFDFQSYRAQLMLREAAARGQTATVRALLAAGVPLQPIPAPKLQPETFRGTPYEFGGWLTVASSHPAVLQVLLAAGASNNDQNDKDLALGGAARSGNVETARALIGYGANPNADLSKALAAESSGGMELRGQGAGSVLIYAAESGNPEMVREILRYHPDLEARDREGKTAIFAVGQGRDTDSEGTRIECLRLLVQAGANVNARDNDGNTPLHEIYLSDVEEELLKLGADVNARNNDGETPIFTNVDDDSIPLFIAHGADLTIRNRKGQTVLEAAKERGPSREAALRKAIDNMNQH